MDAVRVSIALATCNGRQFLSEQLESLLAQTRLPDEIVVGDDNSTDGTRKILDEFAARAPFPVHVAVNAPALGPAANFSRTIARCTGDVIFLCDQDDIWLPGKIERMLHALAARPGCIVAVHDAALVDGGGRPLGMTMAGQLAASRADPAKGLVAGCCMAFDGRLAALYDPPPRTEFHDAWLTAIADRLDARTYVPEALIAYRRHGSNVSQSFMSSASPASRWKRAAERIRRAFSRPVGQSLRAALEAEEDALRALRANREALAGMVGKTRLEKAIGQLQTDCERDARRLRIHSSARMRRPALVARAVADGVYIGPQGALSLLRDIAGAIRK